MYSPYDISNELRKSLLTVLSSAEIAIRACFNTKNCLVSIMSFIFSIIQLLICSMPSGLSNFPSAAINLVAVNEKYQPSSLPENSFLFEAAYLYFELLHIIFSLQ